MLLVAEAGNGSEALPRFREHQPDVTLMDIRLPDRSGIDTVIAIRSEFPAARILMLTTFGEDDYILQALGGGAESLLQLTARRAIGDVFAPPIVVASSRELLPAMTFSRALGSAAPTISSSSRRARPHAPRSTR